MQYVRQIDWQWRFKQKIFQVSFFKNPLKRPFYKEIKHTHWFIVVLLLLDSVSSQRAARKSTIVAISAIGFFYIVSFLVGLAFAVAASANLPSILFLLFWEKTTTKGISWSIDSDSEIIFPDKRGQLINWSSVSKIKRNFHENKKGWISSPLSHKTKPIPMKKN